MRKPVECVTRKGERVFALSAYRGLCGTYYVRVAQVVVVGRGNQQRKVPSPKTALLSVKELCLTSQQETAVLGALRRKFCGAPRAAALLFGRIAKAA